jgi:hypothetical protein
VVTPLSTILKMRLRTRPEVPAQTPYSSRTVSAQVKHSMNTGHTSHSFEARRTWLMDMVGCPSSSPK